MFCVVYRVGGAERFQWRRTLPVQTREEAGKDLQEIRAAGYVGFVESYRLSMAIGLPETYSAADKTPVTGCRSGQYSIRK